jgi:hypothetical protein
VIVVGVLLYRSFSTTDDTPSAGLLEFSGGYLNIPNSNDNLTPEGDFTIELYVNVPPTSGSFFRGRETNDGEPVLSPQNGVSYNTLFSFNVGTSEHFTRALAVDIGTSTCKVWFDSEENDSPLFTANLPSTFNDGNLHHFAMVYVTSGAGGIYHAYVDGIRIDSNVTTSPPLSSVTYSYEGTTYDFEADAFLTVGGKPGDTPGETTFPGKLTNLRFTTDAALYASNFIPPSIPLDKSPPVPGTEDTGTTSLLLLALRSNPLANAAIIPTPVQAIGTVAVDTTTPVPVGPVGTKCGGVVVNFLTDVNNCGQCENSPDQDTYGNFSGYCCNGIVTPVNIVNGDTANCTGCGQTCNLRTNRCCPPTAPNTSYFCAGEDETHCGTCGNFVSCVALHGSTGRCKDDQCIDLNNKLTCGLTTGTVDDVVDCTSLFGANGECHQGQCFDKSSIHTCGTFTNNCTIGAGANTNPSCDNGVCFDSYAIETCGSRTNNCSTTITGAGTSPDCNRETGACYDKNAVTTCGVNFGNIKDCTKAPYTSLNIPACVDGQCVDKGLVTSCGDNFTNCNTEITGLGKLPACGIGGNCYDANHPATCGSRNPLDCLSPSYTPEYSGQSIINGCDPTLHTCINLNSSDTCGSPSNFIDCGSSPCLNGNPPTCASANDRSHCGISNAQCAANCACLNNGTCALANDPAHCGISSPNGVACTTSQYCNNSGTCTTYDRTNCGAIGTTCPAYIGCVVNGLFTSCANANDPLKCGVNLTQCSASQYCNSSGICTAFDRNNCGGFEIACAENQACVSGICQVVNTATNAQNCGTIGNVCPGTSPVCYNSTCYDTASNVNNCGGVVAAGNGQDCSTLGFTTARCCSGTCKDVGIKKYNYSPILNCGSCGNTCTGGYYNNFFDRRFNYCNGTYCTYYTAGQQAAAGGDFPAGSIEST